MRLYNAFKKIFRLYIGTYTEINHWHVDHIAFFFFFLGLNQIYRNRNETKKAHRAFNFEFTMYNARKEKKKKKGGRGKCQKLD